MCKLLEDECNGRKTGKCIRDHKIDEYGSKEIKSLFTYTTNFNLFKMKLQTPPYKTFFEEFQMKYKTITFMVVQPKVQPEEEDFTSAIKQVISLSGKRRYVDKALIKMYQLASTLGVETIEIKDRKISIYVDVNFKLNLSR